MTFLAATGYEDDPHRKPNPLMWTIFCKHLNGGLHVDLAKSFYCGNHAGRKACDTRPADFSAVDKEFAESVGLPFQTPESQFLGDPCRGSKYVLAESESNSSSDEGSESAGDGWAQENELSERTVKCRIKKHNELRAATKAAIAAADATGMTNPKTGRPWNVARKKSRRNEVFDPQYLSK